MWLSSLLFAAIAWLIAVNAQKYDPGDKYPKPGRPLAHIIERHNTCGQEGMAGDYSGYISIAIESKRKSRKQVRYVANTANPY
jgi:hypothetical protein